MSAPGLRRTSEYIHTVSLSSYNGIHGSEATFEEQVELKFARKVSTWDSIAPPASSLWRLSILGQLFARFD